MIIQEVFHSNLSFSYALCILSWGTHAGDVYHNQCHQIYYKTGKKVTDGGHSNVVVKKNETQAKGNYVLAKERQKPQQPETREPKTTTKEPASESPAFEPPKLDLAEVTENCKSKQARPEVVKISISPRGLQLIDHVADRHLSYLKSLKVDEQTLQ